MHREPELSSIPVISVSARGMASYIKNGIDAGFSLYLTRPVGFRELVEVVDQFTQNK